MSAAGKGEGPFWIVRYDGAPDVEYFRWGSGNYPARVDEQAKANRFQDRVDALNVAGNTGGRVVRLVSRAEAVERATRKAHQAGMLAGIRWAYAQACSKVPDASAEATDLALALTDDMLAAMCPCGSEVEDPGEHVAECLFSDPEYDAEKKR